MFGSQLVRTTMLWGWGWAGPCSPARRPAFVPAGGRRRPPPRMRQAAPAGTGGERGALCLRPERLGLRIRGPAGIGAPRGPRPGSTPPPAIPVRPGTGQGIGVKGRRFVRAAAAGQW